MRPLRLAVFFTLICAASPSFAAPALRLQAGTNGFIVFSDSSDRAYYQCDISVRVKFADGSLLDTSNSVSVRGGAQNDPVWQVTYQKALSGADLARSNCVYVKSY